MLCKFSRPICRCFASSKQTSQKQSPMYCKVFTDVTKTIADVLQDLFRIHKDNRRCFASSKQTSQRQSPMYCKAFTDVTKTIADVLQDLYRSHRDNRRCIASSKQTSQRQSPMYCKILIEVTKTLPHKSTNHNPLQVLATNLPMLCKF